ncbi:MAG TPA: DUF1647 domain-containing protein [Verrucomicrobiae bacterium]|nr:DUF1647 domain-containing protein [Verrucomicrobiae bacterium]
MNSTLTIVTGASSNHFLPLQSLLWTISKFEPTARVVVYDLGLTSDEHAELAKSSASVTNWELRTFDFSKYPPHFSMAENAGRMAFRPTVLCQIAHESLIGTQASSPSVTDSSHSSLLLWLDAGCQLREPLEAVKATIQSAGVYCPCAPGTIATCLHPASPASLSVTANLLLLPIRDAGICGFNLRHPGAMALLDRWASIALDKTCTAPDGSTRHTHRQDAVFAVLLNQTAQANNWTLEGKRLRGLAIKQDNLTLAETQFRVLGTAASRRQ